MNTSTAAVIAASSTVSASPAPVMAPTPVPEKKKQKNVDDNAKTRNPESLEFKAEKEKVHLEIHSTITLLRATPDYEVVQELARRALEVYKENEFLSLSGDRLTDIGAKFFEEIQAAATRLGKKPDPAIAKVLQRHHAADQAKPALIAKKKAAPASGLPTIVIDVTNPNDTRVLNAAEAAIIRANCGLYMRGGAPAEVVSRNIFKPGFGWTPERKIVFTTVNRLRELMGKFAEWQKQTEKEVFAISVPKTYADMLFARTDLKFPELSGLATIPMVRPDGSIIEKEGYDPATGLLVKFDQEFPKIPDQPSKSDAKAALAVLKNLLSGWPFVTDADRSVALSAILTSVSRPAIQTAPMFGISATTPGTGKSYLVDVTSMLMNGHTAAVISPKDSEEELQKTLGAVLMEGDALVTIDNIMKPLDSVYLCQVITQPTTKTRVLGFSRTVEVPSALMFATGNNLTVKGDLSRRMIRCSLDAGCENPETRSFDTNPLELARKDRGRYVVAALTILKAFINAGKPSQSQPLGSFEQWSGLVRDALIWLGEADPVTTMAEVKAEDPERTRNIAILNAWKNSPCMKSDKPLTAAEIIKRVTDSSDGDPEFERFLRTIPSGRNELNSEVIGRWLRQVKGRIIDGKRIQGKQNRNKVNEWWLEEVQPSTVSFPSAANVDAEMPAAQFEAANSLFNG